jgi:hypothetical protein
MSALGQKLTHAVQQRMQPIADIDAPQLHCVDAINLGIERVGKEMLPLQKKCVSEGLGAVAADFENYDPPPDGFANRDGRQCSH